MSVSVIFSQHFVINDIIVKFLCLTELRNGLGELACQENNRKNVSEK